jgi:hypothetical protein
MNVGDVLRRLVAKLDAAAGILAMRAATLDLPYIERWVAELGLAEEWRRAQQR